MTEDRDIEKALAERSDAANASADLARRFSEAAIASGDAAVAFATLDTPVGTASVATTDRGIVSVGLPNQPLDNFVERLSAEISPRVVEAPVKLDVARRELTEFFNGDRREFGLALDWTLVPGGFYGRVLRATARLHYGEVMTYGGQSRRPPRGRNGAGNQSAADRRPMPSDHSGRGSGRQLRRRPGAEALAARAGGHLLGLTTLNQPCERGQTPGLTPTRRTHALA
jgi:methylated-DNA-[protein]-cysteine S-methyltransferase